MTQSVTGLDEFFSAENPIDDPLRVELMEMVRYKSANAPRSLQRAMGPSEVSHPCMRRMAFRMMETPRVNPEWDCLPSVIGTATHAWLEDAARIDNERLGRERWLVETKVEVTPGLTGSCDLFDSDNGVVIDHKILGVTSFMAKIKDPGLQYRGQVMLYGKGFVNHGYDVKDVAIAIFPRAGTLSKMHLWREPYDEAKANAILAKREAVIAMLDDFNVEADPARYSWFPIHALSCQFCPNWRPEARGPYQCSGKA